MILADLKERTRTLHAQTESAVSLMQRLASRESYLELLARMYGFYAPIESRISQVVNSSDLGLDLRERQKVPLLRIDLTTLGTSAAQIGAIPLCTQLPAIKTVANVFGCLYVLEGSTLGGQMIRREAHQRLGLTPENGCAFFAGYQERTATAWREFGNALTQYVNTHSVEPEQIFHAAAETFERFAEWVAC